MTASRGSVTTGSGSYSTLTYSAASTASAFDSASTAATMSPANRTVSLAMNGRHICGSMPMNGGGGLLCRVVSASVNTFTPGSSRAADTSSSTILACAIGERTKTT